VNVSTMSFRIVNVPTICMFRPGRSLHIVKINQLLEPHIAHAQIKFPRKIAQVQLQIKEARDTAPLFEKHFFKSHLVRLASLAFEVFVCVRERETA